MIKLIKQAAGHRIALGISGTPEEIEQELNALYNWNVWGRERASLMDTRQEQDTAHDLGTFDFAYVYTTEERLRRGLEGRTFNRILADEERCKQFKGKPGGVKSLVQQELEKTLASIETRVFLGSSVTEIEREH